MAELSLNFTIQRFGCHSIEEGSFQVYLLGFPELATVHMKLDHGQGYDLFEYGIFTI